MSFYLQVKPLFRCPSRPRWASRSVALATVVALLWGSISHLAASAETDAAETDAHFDGVVAGVLAARCLECHRGNAPEGGLDLSQAKTALAGGESGKAILPGKPNDSLLWQRVAAGEMPPDDPLPKAERKILREWIASGAAWGTDPIDPFLLTTDRREGYD